MKFCWIYCILLCCVFCSFFHPTDWNSTDYRISGCIPMPAEDYPLVLPLVMHYLTPTPVAVIGICCIAQVFPEILILRILVSHEKFFKNKNKSLNFSNTKWWIWYVLHPRTMCISITYYYTQGVLKICHSTFSSKNGWIIKI